MKKNQWLIDKYKELEKQKKQLHQATVNNVPEIYACFAKVLIESYKFTPKKIENLFTKTQELWQDLVEHDEIDGMIDWCEKTTGVCLRNGSEQ